MTLRDRRCSRDQALVSDIPPLVRESLRRVSLLADEGRAKLNTEMGELERLVRVDDVLCVGVVVPALDVPLT
jgi:hypothetical protein